MQLNQPNFYQFSQGLFQLLTQSRTTKIFNSYQFFKITNLSRHHFQILKFSLEPEPLIFPLKSTKNTCLNQILSILNNFS